MGKYFGTDGFRGEANKSLCVNHSLAIGRFLGIYFSHNKKESVRVIIGRDTRRSGTMLESALVAGLTEMGADAYLLGVTTTPSVAYLAKIEQFDCGIMISASHNPYFDNGIKLINGNGEKMEESVISLLEAYIDGEYDKLGIPAEELLPAEQKNIGRAISYAGGVERYADYLTGLGKPLTGMRIALDCANGSAYSVAGEVFARLGADISIINNTPDGVNINNNAGSTHIEGLCNYVVDNKLQAGFAYDGDADRCLCVDEDGNVIDGDLILYIYGSYLKEQGRLNANTVVTTVMSNFGLYKAFDEAGIAYAKTAVGDKYVYEYMVANDCVLGGEQSGHIIFRDYASTGDGILTSLKMLEVMSEKKQSLKELAAKVAIYPQVLTNVRVHDKAAAKNDGDVQAAVAKVAEILGNDGRILVRESGTEPIIRVMVEAKDHALCQEMVHRVVQVLQEKGHEKK